MTSKSFDALRRADPRRRPGFDESVQAAAALTRARIASRSGFVAPPRMRRRALRLSAAGAALAVVGAVATVLLTGGSAPVVPVRSGCQMRPRRCARR